MTRLAPCTALLLGIATLAHAQGTPPPQSSAPTVPPGAGDAPLTTPQPRSENPVAPTPAVPTPDRGVITPPRTGNAPGMVVPPPATGTMPVIPPPGSPGGDPAVQPR